MSARKVTACGECDGRGFVVVTGNAPGGVEQDACAVCAIETAIFDFLIRKYVQRADDRQKAMGLQYMEAETNDLARELATFIRRMP